MGHNFYTFSYYFRGISLVQHTFLGIWQCGILYWYLDHYNTAEYIIAFDDIVTNFNYCFYEYIVLL